MVETQNDKHENGLMGIFFLLWKRRWLILLGTITITMIAVVVALLLPKTYLSKAVISLSTIRKSDQDDLPKSIEIPVFRRYSDTFQNRALFLRYSKAKNYEEEWNFDNWDNENEFFNSHLKPIYAFESDERGVKAADNSIMGVVIEGEETSPQKAMKKTEIMGSYLLTTILNMQIGQYFESMSIRSQTAIVNAQRSMITLERETSYLKEKESLIENDLIKLPGMGTPVNRELVTADANSEKYLSPQQQLVSVKMSIKENQIQISRHLKNIKMEQLILSYLWKTKTLLAVEKEYLVNEKLLDELMSEKDKFFTGKLDNESKLAASTFAGQFFYFQKLRSVVYKFISSPSLPENHFKPKRKRLVLGAFFLGFFLFAFLAFILEVREGYKINATDTTTRSNPTHT